MNTLSKIKDQSGAALLTVLIAMMIISIMLFEFQYSTMVERKLAYNDLNQLQAYYLAKAGARIGLLRVTLYGRVRKTNGFGSLLKNGVGPFLELIWNVPLPPFPPDRSQIVKMEKADKDNAETVLEETKISDGVFTHVITSEGSKINLNQLILPDNKLNNRIDFNAVPQNIAEYTAKTLYQLLDNFIRDSEDPRAEYGDMRPEEVVMDIMDWINKGTTRLVGGSKDAWYEQQTPPYKAKRNKLYTVDELRLVRGINEHLFNKLKPYVTVYSEDGRININTAGETLYKAIYSGFTDEDIKKMLEERQNRGGWASEKDFVDYATTTLNRPDFKTLYPDPAQYPFTVGGRAFVIEALGTIKRSGSEIQKVIRIAVALTTPKGGQRLPQFKTEAACKSAGKLWFSKGFQCFEIPTTQDECERGQIPGAIWDTVPAVGRSCCHAINEPPVCPTTPAAGTGAGGSAGTVTQPEADSLKILYWSET